MKTLNVALLTIVLIAPALRASTETGAHAYIQASAVYAIPADEFESGMGASLAAGVSFAKHHAIEMEVISFKTDRTDFVTPISNSKTELKLTPLLMTYRYTFPISAKFSVFVGFSAGATYAKYESNKTFTYYNYWWLGSTIYVDHIKVTGTDTALTGGPQMGWAYELSPQSTITLSVKALYMDSTTVTEGDAFTTLQLGYRFAF